MLVYTPEARVTKNRQRETTMNMNTRNINIITITTVIGQLDNHWKRHAFAERVL